MLPDSIPLTDDFFKSFLEKTITTDQSRRILDGLTKQNAAATTTKPAATEQGSGADDGGNGGQRGERDGLTAPSPYPKGALMYHMNVVLCGLADGILLL